ncbi:MAG: hypothetical protein AUG48_00975 [Actinobacteria bacterium 13_1_20CM_3_68_9]|nr:MAG: hypothetical protein AUG48_00975 [Actinobacteria bacterium 13_1_20CM_3_68_9]
MEALAQRSNGMGKPLDMGLGAEDDREFPLTPGEFSPDALTRFTEESLSVGLEALVELVAASLDSTA